MPAQAGSFERRSPRRRSPRTGGYSYPMVSQWMDFSALGFNVQEKEVACARQFNFQLPEDIAMAVRLLEDSVQTLTGTQKNIILLLDDTQGVYTCLNDAKNPGQKPRELTQVNDALLRQLLQSDKVIHTYLFIRHRLIGVVAVADKADGSPFSIQDTMTLELVARYLATQVLAFQTLQRTVSVPYIQHNVLEMAHHLVAAINAQTVMAGIVQALANQLSFDVCQYVALDTGTGQGQILQEATRTRHVPILETEQANEEAPGVEHRLVTEFSTLTNLMSAEAGAQPYLVIAGPKLGDRPLAELFGVPTVQSMLLVPLFDAISGELQGAFALFQTQLQQGLTPEPSKQDIEIVQETAQLVSTALGRTLVLEKALAMATTDELTSLTNRRGFYDRFEVEIERARRAPAPLSVVLIDVDHFKALNDTYGHLNGDRVLERLAQLLLQNVRRSDVVCRFGGEEFVLLLPSTPLKAAADLTERIRKAIESMGLKGLEGESIPVTVSAGVTEIRMDGSVGEPTRQIISQALAQADEKLYQAKETGRNRVCVTEEL